MRKNYREWRTAALLLPAVVAWGWLTLAGHVHAQTPPEEGVIVVPAGAASQEFPYGAGTLRAANYRIQEVYGAPNFPGLTGLRITELRYRPDSTYGGPFSTTINNIEIRLSTTSRMPDALSTTYTQNPGPDETLVFAGPLTISSQFAGPPGGPKDFDISIPLQTPFLYQPALGHLLVDIRNLSGSGATLLSGQSSGGDSASRVGGTHSATVGTAGTGVDALQIFFGITNGPPLPPPPTLLVRGPYLQRGTTTNILVCWRTSTMTNSFVRFGLAANALPWEAAGFSSTNNHYVLLTNLAPDTKYYYAIGATGTNFSGGPTNFFVTAPVAAKPTRIWAIGDFGTYPIYGTGALSVRDAYYNFTGPRHTDVWLMLGDNAYSYGTDDEYQQAVFPIYPEMLRKTVAWATIGNHETYGSNELGHIAHYDIFKGPKNGEAGGEPSGTLNYYSFDYGNIHFVCLDSEFSDQTPAGPMVTWLEQDLNSNTKDWLIAFWHSPPYTWGSHNSDNDDDTTGHLKNMREVFVPILEAYGVDLVLSGHSHNYERSFLLDGHYGKSWTFLPSMKKHTGSGQPGNSGPYRKPTAGPGANQGAVYVVAGSSGFATSRFGQHPAMYASILNMGSLVLDVDGNRLDGKFVRETGAIGDSFTILKGSPQFTSVSVSAGVVTVTFKGTVGYSYRIQRAANLEAPDWQAVSGIIVAEGATTAWSGPAPAGPARGFYRVEQLD